MFGRSIRQIIRKGVPPSNEKAQTGLYYRFCAYHERELLPQREALSHLHFIVRMTGVADDTVVRVSHQVGNKRMPDKTQAK